MKTINTNLQRRPEIGEVERLPEIIIDTYGSSSAVCVIMKRDSRVPSWLRLGNTELGPGDFYNYRRPDTRRFWRLQEECMQITAVDEWGMTHMNSLLRNKTWFDKYVMDDHGRYVHVRFTTPSDAPSAAPSEEERVDSTMSKIRIDSNGANYIEFKARTNCRTSHFYYAPRGSGGASRFTHHQRAICLDAMFKFMDCSEEEAKRLMKRHADIFCTAAEDINLFQSSTLDVDATMQIMSRCKLSFTALRTLKRILIANGSTTRLAWEANIRAALDKHDVEGHFTVMSMKASILANPKNAQALLYTASLLDIVARDLDRALEEGCIDRAWEERHKGYLHVKAMCGKGGETFKSTLTIFGITTPCSPRWTSFFASASAC